MNKINQMLMISIISISLIGCAQGAGEKQTLGTLIGAGLGGLVGSQIGGGKGKMIAIGAGVLLGGLLGSEIGQSMDQTDRMYMEQATYDSLENSPTGYETEWNNPDSGYQGIIRPLKTYREPSGRYCREYQADITIGPETVASYGTACRQPDGSWQIQ